MISAEGINIEPTTSCVARVDREFFWFALAFDIRKDRLDTMLMKLTQLPKADEKAQ